MNECGDCNADVVVAQVSMHFTDIGPSQAWPEFPVLAGIFPEPAPALSLLADFQVSFQCPAHHFPREPTEDHRQIDKLRFQSDVGDVGHPQLIDASQFHTTGEVKIYL